MQVFCTLVLQLALENSFSCMVDYKRLKGNYNQIEIDGFYHWLYQLISQSLLLTKLLSSLFLLSNCQQYFTSIV